MPCIDDHISQYESSGIEITSIDLNESHIDLCSPFCFCQCCQTYSRPEIQLNFSKISRGIPQVIRASLENQTIFTISHWHPPKV